METMQITRFSLICTFLFSVAGMIYASGADLSLSSGGGIWGTTVPKCALNAVPETSGLVYTGGQLWSHGDHGNSAEIYAIDTVNGSVIQTVRIDNFANTDWEDIAADQDFIYIGDFGNNDGIRTDLQVLKITKSEIGNQSLFHVQAQAISFSYLDQKSFAPDTQTNFDCESLISMGDSLYLFTKDHGDFKTRVYSLPKIAGNYQISPVTEFNVAGKVCGADYDPVSNQIILIGYGGSKLNSFLYLLSEFQGNQFFSGVTKKQVIGNNYTEWQTEGVCFTDSGHLLISCETTSDVPASLYSFDFQQNQTTSATKGIPVKINCFPNPADNYLEIISEEKIRTLIIRDTQGVEKLTISVNDCQYRLDIAFLRFKNGLLFLEIHTGNQVVVKKILINH